MPRHVPILKALLLTLVAACAFGAPAPDAPQPPPEPPINGRVTVILEKAVWQQKSEEETVNADLQLDLFCDNGQWRDAVYGMAYGAAGTNNSTQHGGKIKEATVEGDRVRLVLAMNFERDNAVWGDTPFVGGSGEYVIELNREGDRFGGQYVGSFAPAVNPVTGQTDAPKAVGGSANGKVIAPQ